jgi:hypothetical protein
VRAAIKAAPVPMPVQIVDNVARLNPEDAREVLRDHPGFMTWEKTRSYKASLGIFERAAEDLLRAIRSFEELSRDATIFDRMREDELKELERSVQKELFATTNAAHSLVEHSTRRLQKSIEISDYDQHLAECFRDDGLHDFVIGLRRIVHHVVMVRPGWQITQQANVADWQARFKLDRDELSLVVQAEADTMNAAGRRFLAKAGPSIDLQLLFEEYRRRAREFHSWFSRVIEAQPLEDMRDYERCLKENRKNTTRTFWKAMLGNWMNWDKPPNPYEYLHRYLNAEQLTIVRALPERSDEQIDKIIEFIDTDSACDEELRHRAYELFRRAT